MGLKSGILKLALMIPPRFIRSHLMANIIVQLQFSKHTHPHNVLPSYSKLDPHQQEKTLEPNTLKHCSLAEELPLE